MNQQHISEIADALRSWPRRSNTLLIAIDGPGGSGKSTLARRLETLLGDCTVVEIDDFYFPSAIRPDDPNRVGGNHDVDRVREQVVQPLALGEPGRYQRYDWELDDLAEWHDVPAGGIVILEGIYSSIRPARELFDLSMWVETPRGIRLQRGIDRDGEETRSMWEDVWMPSEDLYIERELPQSAATFVFAGDDGFTSGDFVTVLRAPALQDQS